MKIFWVAAIFTPKHQDLTKAAPEPDLVVAPMAVMAKDEAAARLKCAAMVAVGMLDQTEVLVRPF